MGRRSFGVRLVYRVFGGTEGRRKRFLAKWVEEVLRRSGAGYEIREAKHGLKEGRKKEK